MRNVDRRLECLEDLAAKKDSEWIVPIEARVHMKAVARHQAREDDKRPPSYTEEEIEAMRRWDLETVEGRGVEAQLRDNPGWKCEETREFLCAWEEGARRRLAATDGLPRERWHEVYERDGDDEEPGVASM
jgi:hypothetical protein